MNTKILPAGFVILFLMLGVIWVPSFSNLGNLFFYAENVKYHNVSLLTIFKAELLVLIVVWVFLLSYSKVGEIFDGNSIIRRHLIMVVFIIGQVFVGFIAGGFLVHKDASWYQLVHDADEIMPAQAIILLICYPMYLFFGGSAYIYAKTRLPSFVENKETAFMVLTFTPLAFLPYYDASFLEVGKNVMELVYLSVYWLLSMSWVLFGVGFLIVKSAKEILKGLKDPYGEM